MRDKTGHRILCGDLVLLANDGPYLNFAQVVDESWMPCGGIMVVEAYQPGNDPAQEMLLRRRTVNSPNRVLLLENSQVSSQVRKFLGLGCDIVSHKDTMFDIPVVMDDPAK